MSRRSLKLWIKGLLHCVSPSGPPLKFKPRQTRIPSDLHRPTPTQFYLPLREAFSLCLLSHFLAAAYAPIQDCDEVFNYWEPLHYLNHGYGFQTWEYSPVYAIRSWFYIVIHAIPARLAFQIHRSKIVEFYALRFVLAFICAATETRLYAVISRSLHPRVGITYLMIIAFAPGVFSASVALLPSSFAMYASSLGLAAFMDWRGGPRTAAGIMWFGIGAIVGWPFSGVLIAPFLAEEVLMSVVVGQGFKTFRRFLDGVVRCLIVLVGIWGSRNFVILTDSGAPMRYRCLFLSRFSHHTFQYRSV